MAQRRDRVHVGCAVFREHRLSQAKEPRPTQN
jgi:hypothetical protein